MGREFKLGTANAGSPARELEPVEARTERPFPRCVIRMEERSTRGFKAADTDENRSQGCEHDRCRRWAKLEQWLFVAVVHDRFGRYRCSKPAASRAGYRPIASFQNADIGQIAVKPS